MRRSVLLALLAAPLPVACHLAGGLDGLEFSDATGTGAATATSSTSSGGSGGAAGATTTTTGTGVGAGGMAGGSASGGAGGSGEPPCHPPGLVDEFDGAALDAARWGSWTDTDVTLGVAGGVAFVQPPAGIASEGRYGGFYAQSSTDLTDCSAWIEVVTPLDTSVPGGVYVELWYDGDNDAEINVEQGRIYFEIEVGGSPQDGTDIAYSPTEHRWLRFREEAGTLYEETSPDGRTWTVRLSGTTPWWIGEVTFGFGAGTWDYTEQPGRAEFDNVDVVP